MKKAILKPPQPRISFPPTAVLQFTGKLKSAEFINRRCKGFNAKTVESVLKMKFRDASGCERKYKARDLKYDLDGGSLRIMK